MQSECGVVAVPGAADTWTDIEDFTVPAGVKRLTGFIVSVAPDFGAAVNVRYAPVFRLEGSGLLEQSPHEYVGNFGNMSHGTIGAACVEPNNRRYDVDIPVQTGGVITAQVNTLDEAITAGTVRVQVLYDNETVKQANSQSQYIDAALTVVAGAWAAVGSIIVPRMAEGKSPTKIKKVVIGMATDQAAIALLRCSGRIRLTGAGIAEGGSHEILGPASGTVATTDGVLAYDHQTVECEIEIPINAGGEIEVEQYLDTETPTAGTVAVGLMYE